MPFRPKRSDTYDNVDLENLKLNGDAHASSNAVSMLEAKVNGLY